MSPNRLLMDFATSSSGTMMTAVLFGWITRHVVRPSSHVVHPTCRGLISMIRSGDPYRR
jgi:hypothetical protein